MNLGKKRKRATNPKRILKPGEIIPVEIPERGIPVEFPEKVGVEIFHPERQDDYSRVRSTS
jgi:hypothetical protein